MGPHAGASPAGQHCHLPRWIPASSKRKLIGLGWISECVSPKVAYMGENVLFGTQPSLSKSLCQAPAGRSNRLTKFTCGNRTTSQKAQGAGSREPNVPPQETHQQQQGPIDFDISESEGRAVPYVRRKARPGNGWVSQRGCRRHTVWWLLPHRIWAYVLGLWIHYLSPLDFMRHPAPLPPQTPGPQRPPHRGDLQQRPQRLPASCKAHASATQAATSSSEPSK